MSDVDEEMMKRALAMGRKGDPSPNPHVGAVIAVGKTVIAEGYHHEAGGEHAETVAIKEAGHRTRGATLYVTLEPCAHQGKTPPCIDIIISAGIRRVVIGHRDPNPNIVGDGARRLEEAGIEVTMGILEKDCGDLIRPWHKYITEQVSYVSLKLGISLDGRIATKTGASQWITCDESRAKAHALRAAHDAVMIGLNTVVADDPMMTVREAPGRNPIRIVVDSNLRIPLDKRIITTAKEIPTCVVTTEEASESIAEALLEREVNVIRVAATAEGRCDMTATLKALAAREVVSVLCEGGAELAGSLLAGRIPGELHVFVAPRLLGPRGRPWAVDWAGPDTPAQAPYVDNPSWELCGTDGYVSGKLEYPKKKPTTAA